MSFNNHCISTALEPSLTISSLRFRSIPLTFFAIPFTYLNHIIPGCNYPPPRLPYDRRNLSSLYIPLRTHWIIEAPSVFVSATECSSRSRKSTLLTCRSERRGRRSRPADSDVLEFPFLLSQRLTPKTGRSFRPSKIPFFASSSPRVACRQGWVRHQAYCRPSTALVGSRSPPIPTALRQQQAPHGRSAHSKFG